MRAKLRGGAHLGDVLHRWRVLDCWRDVREHRGGAPRAQARAHRGAGRPDKWRDTVGELGSAEICVSHMPSWKAKKLGKLTQEKVLPEL